MVTKYFYLYDKFFVLNQNFTAEHVKIVKIPGFPGFLVIFVQNSRFFLNSQIPYFSRFPG